MADLRNADCGARVGNMSQAGWRAFDIVVALAILLAIIPFLLLLVTVLLVSDPGPILFAHRRVGRRGEPFNCLKFRSMYCNGETVLQEYLASNPDAMTEWRETQKLRSDPRATPVGAFMRRLSLDEFPQLINVLRGEMSIVGPRPITDAEIPRYGRYFAHYCRVRPGLTGLWQTSGRSDTSYRRRVAMDVSYIERKSVAFDSWLLCRTIPAVVLAKGAY